MGIVVGALVALVVLVIAGWVFYTLAAGKAGKEAERQHATDDPRIETLRYRIPDAQDPTVLIAALDQAGYTSDLDDVAGEKQLVVACPAGRDRERARVRSLLGEQHITGIEGQEFSPGRVTFEDEK